MNRLKQQPEGKRIKIVCVDRDRGRFAVHGTTGNQYEIRYCGSGDADPEYVGLWECTCPAGRHGRDCRHMTLFTASRFTDPDQYIEGDAIEQDETGAIQWIPNEN